MLAVRHGAENHSNAALFVLQSELEGRCLALLDAMAAGIGVPTSEIPENFAASPQPVNASGFRVSISGPKSPALSKKPITNVLGWSANEHTPSGQIQIRSAAR